MKTFSKIINDIHGIGVSHFDLTDTLSLMRMVRRETLKECAKIVSLQEDEYTINGLNINSLEV